MRRTYATALPALLLAALINTAGPAVSAAGTEPATRPAPDRIAAVMVLNYLQASVAKITASPNKLVLEREYEALVENIDLSAVPDKDESDLIQGLMDTFVSARLAESERRQMRLDADARADAAMRDLVGRMMDAAENPPGALVGAAHAVIAYLDRDEEARAEAAAADLRLEDKLLVALNEFQ